MCVGAMRTEMEMKEKEIGTIMIRMSMGDMRNHRSKGRWREGTLDRERRPT